MSRRSALLTAALSACTTAPTDAADDTDPDTDTDAVDTQEPEPLDPFEATATGELTSPRGYALAWTFTPFPATTGDALLQLTSDAAEVDVLPWMSVHGHGAGGLDVEDLGEGSWQAAWSYIMPGPWEVTVTVEGPAGADEIVFEVDVSDP